MELLTMSVHSFHLRASWRTRPFNIALWPVLWRFADEHASDHTLGQSIVGAAEEILGALTEALAG